MGWYWYDIAIFHILRTLEIIFPLCSLKCFVFYPRNGMPKLLLILVPTQLFPKFYIYVISYQESTLYLLFTSTSFSRLRVICVNCRKLESKMDEEKNLNTYKSYYQGRTTINILAYIFIFFPLFLWACMYVNVYVCFKIAFNFFKQNSHCYICFITLFF